MAYGLSKYSLYALAASHFDSLGEGFEVEADCAWDAFRLPEPSLLVHPLGAQRPPSRVCDGSP